MSMIRKASLGDAAALSEIAEATFRETFGATNTAEHMQLHCEANYAESIQAAEISNPAMITLVVEERGVIIGYAQMRWSTAPGCVLGVRPGEIQRLYVVKGWHGKGVAQGLMRACISELKKRGSDVVWLGVWEFNPRAIAFYSKYGFVEVGDHTFPLGGDPQRDIIMVRSLSSAQSI